jgi:hypothetical protein
MQTTFEQDNTAANKTIGAIAYDEAYKAIVKHGLASEIGATRVAQEIAKAVRSRVHIKVTLAVEDSD